MILAPQRIGLIDGLLPGGRLTLEIDHTDIAPQQLFALAARNNPKRAFLFLSKVLGKHLPVRPAALRDTHERIAAGVPVLPGPVLFIGMAETATALGHGVFEAWLGANAAHQGLYLHTTRYRVRGSRQIRFEEAHSHAPRLLFNVPSNPETLAFMAGVRSLVLIDDEISTGNTFVNLTRACRELTPAIEHIHLATITDFLGHKRRQMLSERFRVPVTVGALLSGAWRFEPHPWECDGVPEAQVRAGAEVVLDDGGFGRMGCRLPLRLNPMDVRRIGAGIAPNQHVLVLGTGEFMHAPAVLARALEHLTGCQAWTHATTRSPILEWGPIQDVMCFPDTYGEKIPNYLYNMNAGQYDHVLLCHETPCSSSLLSLAQALGARLIHFHSEHELEDASVR